MIVGGGVAGPVLEGVIVEAAPAVDVEVETALGRPVGLDAVEAAEGPGRVLEEGEAGARVEALGGLEDAVGVVEGRVDLELEAERFVEARAEDVVGDAVVELVGEVLEDALLGLTRGALDERGESLA